MTNLMNGDSSYRKVHDGLLRMHQLFVEGKRDCEEVNAIRDATDEPWNDLSDEEKATLQGLSQDLYEVEGVARNKPNAASPLSVEAWLSEAVHAQEKGHLDRALKLLRKCQGCVASGRLAQLRGSIWLEKKDPKTAAIFFKHAVDLDPTNESARI